MWSLNQYTGSPIAYAGYSTANYAILGTSDSPDEVLLPTYNNSFEISQQNPKPLVRLQTFDKLRATINKARRCIFAAKAGLGTKVQNRIELTGEERDFDYTLALYFYRRDISGDFGVAEKGETGSEVSYSNTEALRRDSAFLQVAADADERLARIEQEFRVKVLQPLEDRLITKAGGSGSPEGAGLFKRKLSWGGRNKIDYKELAAVAGPLIQEAKDVHLAMEDVVLKAVKKPR